MQGSREWKATLRVYKASSGSVFVIFQIRAGSGKSNRVDFELSSNPVAGKPPALDEACTLGSPPAAVCQSRVKKDTLWLVVPP